MHFVSQYQQIRLESILFLADIKDSGSPLYDMESLSLFRLHQMHEVQTIVTDVCVVSLSCHVAQLCVLHSCSLCPITLASCLMCVFLSVRVQLVMNAES